MGVTSHVMGLSAVAEEDEADWKSSSGSREAMPAGASFSRLATLQHCLFSGVLRRCAR